MTGIRKINVKELDPCFGVGFLLKESKDLQELERAFKYELKPLATFCTTKPEIRETKLMDLISSDFSM